MTCVRCEGFVIIDRYSWPVRDRQPGGFSGRLRQLRLDRGSRDTEEPQPHGDGYAPPSECPSGCARPDWVLRFKTWIGRLRKEFVMTNGTQDIWGIVLAGSEGERLKKFVREFLGSEAPKQFCAFLG